MRGELGTCAELRLPALTPERWLRDFDGLGFAEDVRALILKDNAVRLLGLDGGADG